MLRLHLCDWKIELTCLKTVTSVTLHLWSHGSMGSDVMLLNCCSSHFTSTVPSLVLHLSNGGDIDPSTVTPPSSVHPSVLVERWMGVRHKQFVLMPSFSLCSGGAAGMLRYSNPKRTHFLNVFTKTNVCYIYCQHLQRRFVLGLQTFPRDLLPVTRDT